MENVNMLDLQNRSHAGMAQRHEKLDSLDDFPTPPWATRALMEHVLSAKDYQNKSCREPACGRGYMSRPLEEYFGSVQSSDIGNYGFGKEENFVECLPSEKTNWMITNPPFKLAEDFIFKGLELTSCGVAVLVRTVFLESIGRYNRLFSKIPPSYVAQFVERVPIVKGRVDPKASSATGYAWIVWKKLVQEPTRVIWIPPCRKKLEKTTDYFLDGPINQVTKNQISLLS